MVQWSVSQVNEVRNTNHECAGFPRCRRACDRVLDRDTVTRIDPSKLCPFQIWVGVWLGSGHVITSHYPREGTWGKLADDPLCLSSCRHCDQHIHDSCGRRLHREFSRTWPPVKLTLKDLG